MIKKNLLKTALLSMCLTANAYAFQLQATSNLEDNAQSFVLDTKRISLPDFPHAFNPSIVRWQGALLLSFRVIRDQGLAEKSGAAHGNSRIGLVWLDDDFNPISTPQLLVLDNFWEPCASHARAEDARLAICGGSLYLIYSDNIDDPPADGGFRMHVAELYFALGRFWVLSNDRLTNFDGFHPNRREKNWTPFDYMGNLVMAYSLNPHKIFVPILGTGECEKIAETLSDIRWGWGELRGGTPAIPIDSKRYLSFFHSSMELETVHSSGKNELHYFMGAYTFDMDPPFALTSISAEPIIAKKFYTGEDYTPYWKPVRVVFPCGIMADEEFVWVSYGRQDHEMWIMKLDKQRLLNSLEPIPKSIENLEFGPSQSPGFDLPKRGLLL